MFRFLLSKIFHNREKMKNDVKPFLDHLEDLRGTIFKMAATLVISVSVCFIWNSEIAHFLQRPLWVNGYDPKEVLVAIDVIGPFMTSLTLSFYAGIVVSFPLLVYFLAEFILPAMNEREKKFALPAVTVGFFLFLGGAAFCFYQMAPAMVKFMAEWSIKQGIKVQYSVSNYYKLVSLISIVFGLLCQIPVVMIALHGVGIIDYAWIKNTRAYAYAGILTLCAVVSPTPDIPSLVMFSLPIMGLYEICIWVIYAIEKRRPPEAKIDTISKAAPAAMPYTAAQDTQSTGHYEDPYQHDDPNHYSDGHYHDDHYHHDHHDGSSGDATLLSEQKQDAAPAEKTDPPKTEEAPKPLTGLPPSSLPPSSKPPEPPKE